MEVIGGIFLGLSLYLLGLNYWLGLREERKKKAWEAFMRDRFKRQEPPDGNAA